MLINTIMMPKKRIPWPLPDGYRLLTSRKESLPSNNAEVSQSPKSKPLRDDTDPGDTDVIEKRGPEEEIKTHTHFNGTVITLDLGPNSR